MDDQDASWRGQCEAARARIAEIKATSRTYMRLTMMSRSAIQRSLRLLADPPGAPPKAP